MLLFIGPSLQNSQYGSEDGKHASVMQEVMPVESREAPTTTTYDAGARDMEIGARKRGTWHRPPRPLGKAFQRSTKDAGSYSVESSKVIVHEGWLSKDLQILKNSKMNGVLSSGRASCSVRGVEAVQMLVGDHLAGVSNTTGRFNHCALVGGARAVRSKHDGAIIDQHEAVFRVNRLPTRHYHKYIGGRTSVYFAGSVADARQRFVKKGYLAQLVNVSGSSLNCRYVGGTCNINNLVMNSGMLPIDGNWTERYPPWYPGWRPNESDFPIGHMSTTLLNVVRLAERTVIGLPVPKRSTSGISAFFLAAVLCDRLDVYGMALEGRTLDEHAVGGAHDLAKEREFLLNVGRGRDLRHDSCEPLGHDVDCRILNRILCAMAAKAREGKLRFSRPPPVHHVHYQTDPEQVQSWYRLATKGSARTKAARPQKTTDMDNHE